MNDDLPLVRVEITEVQERLSVARTYKCWKANVGGMGIGLSGFITPPEWITRYETLKASEHGWEEFDEEKSLVKTGDPVVQILDDSE